MRVNSRDVTAANVHTETHSLSMVHKRKHQKLIFAYTHTHTYTNKNPQPNFPLQMPNPVPKGGYKQNTEGRKTCVIELQVLICIYVLATASRASVSIVQGVSKTVSRIPKVSLAHKNKDISYECKPKNPTFAEPQSFTFLSTGTLITSSVRSSN